jgi:hypothetical protein
MDELTAYRQELLLALERAVNELSQKVADTLPGDWYRVSGGNIHTPHYTLAHLRALEALEFAIQIRHILEEKPLLSIFDDEAWMASHYRLDEPAWNIMEDIASLHKQELIELHNLPTESWSRSARHPWWGVHTLQWWVELQLDYSYRHLREIYRLLDM